MTGGPGRAPLLVGLVAAMCVGPALASGPSNSTVLDDLAHDDFTVRQRATRDLLAEDQLDQEQIQALYRRARVPEQQHRLLQVAHHHAVRRMRAEILDDDVQSNAAIGIRHEPFGVGQFPGLEQPGLIVVETFPGFPGHAHLQRGDLILAMDDQRFPANLSPEKLANRFVGMVQQRRPGDLGRFTVMREGRTIDVHFRLASLGKLRRMYKDARALQQPFLDRWLAIEHNLAGRAPDRPPIAVDQPQAPDAKHTPRNAQESAPTDDQPR